MRNAIRLILIFCFLISTASLFAQPTQSFPFQNASLPVQKRVQDLLSRLTLDEKVAQMMNATPAVPRLGIPAYDWWNETLHGVARTPFHTTSYPQAIGMAATWDTASIHLMGDYSAAEGRAIHDKSVQLGKEGDRYVGLTYWTPNINIFRDPRWGRGQETYGEDPYLTAMMAGSFVRGLQGTDPFYLKAAACAKHFAVHSGPEPTRHSDNVNPSLHDLWDTYLPAFRQLVVKDKVAGVMCAYNAVNTQPCCANDLLMQDILRKQWGFTGYVTSDCWAIDDFFRYHKTHKDAKASAIDALIHATDVECGNSVYSTLKEAVQNGEIKEAYLDSALTRLFTIRFRLGFFDPPEKNPYSHLGDNALESPEHAALALKMAEQSVVLLKNENQTLPLSQNLKTILVLGPNTDNKSVMLGNYNGVPSRVVSLLDGIKEMAGPQITLLYPLGYEYAADSTLLYEETDNLFYDHGKPGVRFHYFGNENMEGLPVYSEVNTGIDKSWTEGEEPVKGLGSTHYSIRVETELHPESDKLYHFEVNADDGYRVYVNGKLIMDYWTQNPGGSKFLDLDLKKDSVYILMIQMRQSEGNASIHFRPAHYVKVDFAQLQRLSAIADVIIYCGGISPQLEGEEMPVAVPGFKGGDRTSIMLPAIQTKVLQALLETGKPVVFVMLTGSALAIPWEAEHIPAIVNGWYGGQSGGTAVAEVLFGKYNPAGRLPVTFYRSDNDLPAFGDYTMQGRTYRYFHKPVLYPFGYGLSYSKFEYSPLKLPAALKKGQKLEVPVTVKNSSTLDGEEVVQLYLSFPDEPGAPVCALKGFKRILIKAGATQKLQFVLSAEDLSLINEKGQAYQPKGKMVLSVGGGQPDQNHASSGNIVKKVIQIR